MALSGPPDSGGLEGLKALLQSWKAAWCALLADQDSGMPSVVFLMMSHNSQPHDCLNCEWCALQPSQQP